jgi:hypothetical protein
MAHLVLASFTQKTVVNPRMLRSGGGVALGQYTRRAKNIVSSPGLISRNEWTATNMRANCSVRDKCLPSGMKDTAVGQPVPGEPGKVYARCTVAEASKRLDDARTCAMRTLATKGGVYSRAG